MSFLDKTFCASPSCKNECGRKMTEIEKNNINALPDCNQNVWYGYFCDDPRVHILEEGKL